MTAITELVHACGVEPASLRSEAEKRRSDWARWLEPISQALPAGDDPAYDDQFMQIREEVNKLSGFDTDTIARLSESLLTTVSKDIRVITFYAWARLHQDGEQGLAEGLELLAAALHQYGDQLHPQRSRSRQGALAWLGSARMLDSLTLWPEADIARVCRISGALLLIEDALSEDERNGLQPLLRALELRLAQNGGASAMVPLNSPAHADVDDSALAALAPVNSGETLKAQAKVLANYLREQPGGWLSAHHLMKSVRWDTILNLPALGPGGNTRLPPPKPDHRAHLKRLYLQQSWTEMLELTDSLFAQAINHVWFDLQWYACEALNRQDKGMALANIVQQDLHGLLSRLPGLETLCYSDGTPFADEVTRSWIAQKVMGDVRLTESDAPIAGPDNDILSLESEAVEKAEVESVEAALAWLQMRPGASNTKDQWLLRLLMARVCEQFGKSEMALHLLDELNQQAGALTLTQWEPTLLFEVRARRLKLLRARAARSESERSRVQPEMDALLSGLITLDPVRAAILCS
ncbi:type VI secretion system protein TssA (plasmid) [Pantoea sp. BJ2]|uniref:Type VI secretion system protein TssA n=1 Tax=Pantoea sp. BJ2 TaxID=3141322 RepID=A0AAU7U4P5_9GAMM